MSARAPQVAVVVAAHNSERYVGDTVRSILAERFRDIELVVVDDGSTDGTVAAVQRAIHGDSRARILRQEHRGEGRSKNDGIRATTAELVSVVDHDDVCHPDRLLCQVEQLVTRPDLAASFTYMAAIDELGAPMSWTRIGHQFDPRITSRADMVEALFAARNHFGASTVLIRRWVLERIGLYAEGIFAPDIDLWLRLLREHEVAVIPRELVACRVHPGSQTHQTSGGARSISLSLSILRALQSYSIEDFAPRLRALPAGSARDRATAQAHLTLATQLERSGLLELLPMVLHHRLCARALAPDLVPEWPLPALAAQRDTFGAAPRGRSRAPWSRAWTAAVLARLRSGDTEGKGRAAWFTQGTREALIVLKGTPERRAFAALARVSARRDPPAPPADPRPAAQHQAHLHRTPLQRLIRALARAAGRTPIAPG